MARVVKEVVSDAISNHLNDPRIEKAFVSVVRVEIAGNLRSAEVYLSIFDSNRISQNSSAVKTAKSDSARNKVFAAITRGKSRIQSLLAYKMKSKFCPVLTFHQDQKFKETLETMKLIDRVSDELKSK